MERKGERTGGGGERGSEGKEGGPWVEAGGGEGGKTPGHLRRGVRWAWARSGTPGRGGRRGCCGPAGTPRGPGQGGVPSFGQYRKEKDPSGSFCGLYTSIFPKKGRSGESPGSRGSRTGGPLLGAGEGREGSTGLWAPFSGSERDQSVQSSTEKGCWGEKHVASENARNACGGGYRAGEGARHQEKYAADS